MSFLQILADATTQTTGQTTGQPANGTQPVPFWANPSQMFLPLLIGVMLLIMFSSSRTKKNEQKIRDDMLKNLKRGDRVMTAGGILGTVVDVRESEVVLKVDESSNTKIKFSRDAIKRVLAEEETPVAK